MRLHSMQQALKLQAHIKPARAAQSANPAGRGHPLSVLLQRRTKGKPSWRGAAATGLGTWEAAAVPVPADAAPTDNSVSDMSKKAIVRIIPPRLAVAALAA